MDIRDPPTIVKIVKNNEASNCPVYIVIPEVEIDDVTAKITFEKPASGIIKK